MPASLLNRPLPGFFDGDARRAEKTRWGRARRRPRAVPVPDAHGDGRADVVGRRGDANHRHVRHGRPVAHGVARRHRAPPRGGAPRRAASGARADRHRRAAAGRARQHRAPRRERGRRLGLHRPPARRGRRRPSSTAPRPACPTAISRRCEGLSIGPKAGSCGTAMYRGEPVIVVDVLTDPLWRTTRISRRSSGSAPAGPRQSSHPSARCWDRWRCTTRSRARRATPSSG